MGTKSRGPGKDEFVDYGADSMIVFSMIVIALSLVISVLGLWYLIFFRPTLKISLPRELKPREIEEFVKRRQMALPRFKTKVELILGKALTHDLRNDGGIFLH